MHRAAAVVLLAVLYLLGAYAVHRLVRLQQLMDAGVDVALLATQRPLAFVLLAVAVAGAAIVHALLARLK